MQVERSWLRRTIGAAGGKTDSIGAGGKTDSIGAAGIFGAAARSK